MRERARAHSSTSFRATSLVVLRILRDPPVPTMSIDVALVETEKRWIADADDDDDGEDDDRETGLLRLISLSSLWPRSFLSDIVLASLLQHNRISAFFKDTREESRRDPPVRLVWNVATSAQPHMANPASELPPEKDYIHFRN